MFQQPLPCLCFICKEEIKAGDFIVSLVESVTLLGITTIGVHLRCARNEELPLPSCMEEASKEPPRGQH